MIIKALILFMFSFSVYADSCGFQYLRHYNERELKKLQKITKSSFDKLKRQINKAKTPEEKMSLIEEQYDLIAKVFATQREIIKVIIAFDDSVPQLSYSSRRFYKISRRSS